MYNYECFESNKSIALKTKRINDKFRFDDTFNYLVKLPTTYSGRAESPDAEPTFADMTEADKEIAHEFNLYLYEQLKFGTVNVIFDSIGSGADVEELRSLPVAQLSIVDKNTISPKTYIIVNTRDIGIGITPIITEINTKTFTYKYSYFITAAIK